MSDFFGGDDLFSRETIDKDRKADKIHTIHYGISDIIRKTYVSKSLMDKIPLNPVICFFHVYLNTKRPKVSVSRFVIVIKNLKIHHGVIGDQPFVHKSIMIPIDNAREYMLESISNNFSNNFHIHITQGYKPKLFRTGGVLNFRDNLRPQF